MINAVNIILLAALIIFSLLDIFGLYTNRESLALFAKPFLVPLIIALYILPILLRGRLLGERKEIILTLVIGLVFGWLGDVLLMKKELFILGLLAFLVGHIFYIITFARDIRLSGLSWLLLIIIAPYLLMILFVNKQLLKSLPDKRLALPVMIYMLVILSMSTCAFLRFSTRPFLPALLTFLGSVLFLFSDTILAFHNFKKNLGNKGSAMIMITYIPAQFLIMAGTGIL